MTSFAAGRSVRHAHRSLRNATLLHPRWRLARSGHAGGLQGGVSRQARFLSQHEGRAGVLMSLAARFDRGDARRTQADIFHAVKAIVAVQRDYGRRDDRKQVRRAASPALPRQACACDHWRHASQEVVWCGRVKKQPRYGTRKRAHVHLQARLKYLVSEWGIDKFRAVTEQYLGKRFAPFRPLPAWEHHDYLGWGEQGDGCLFVGCFIQNGRLKGEMKSTLRSVRAATVAARVCCSRCRRWHALLRRVRRRVIVMTGVSSAQRVAGRRAHVSQQHCTSAQVTEECRPDSSTLDSQVIEEYDLSVRLTPNQNLILCDVQPAWREPIAAALAAAGVRTPEELDSLDRFAMACPALPLCGLAIGEAERGLPDVTRRVRALLEKLGLHDETIVMRMTGCANGCAPRSLEPQRPAIVTHDATGTYVCAQWRRRRARAPAVSVRSRAKTALRCVWSSKIVGQQNGRAVGPHCSGAKSVADPLAQRTAVVLPRRLARQAPGRQRLEARVA